MSVRCWRGSLFLVVLVVACRFDTAGAPASPAGDRASSGEQARGDLPADTSQPDAPARLDIAPAGDFQREAPPPLADLARPPELKAGDLKPGDLKPPPDQKPLPDQKPVDPCGGCLAPTPVCCNKGTGLKCYSNTGDCLCDPATAAPCKGTSYPYCCDRGAGLKCTNTTHECKCDPVTKIPCAGSNCDECRFEMGFWGCHSCD